MKPSVELPELSRWIATEVRLLSSRVVSARAEEMIRHLDAARQALEAAVIPADGGPALAAPDEGEMQQLRDRVASQGVFQAIRMQIADRDAVIHRLRDDITAGHMEAERMRVEVERAQAEIQRAQTEMQRAQTESQRAHAEVGRVQAELELVRAEFERERAELERERLAAPPPPVDVARLAADFETTIDDMRREHIEAVGEQAAAYTALPLDALLSVFSTFKRASTTAEVLDSIVDGLGREFARVALFDASGSALVGRRQIGFDWPADLSKVRMPADDGSFIARALATGRLEAHFPASQNDDEVALPFGGTPACAMAIPFVLRGRPVAVVYADDSDSPEFATGAPQARAKFAELLQEHGLLVLLSVGLNEDAAADLGSFAALLVEEIAYAHESDCEAGKNVLERQQTLRQKVEHSRRMFAERSAQEGSAGSPLLEQQLQAAADAQRETPFGLDLSAILTASRTPRASVLMMRR